MKRDRLQCKDSFAGLIHWFNLLLKPTRRTSRAKLASGVYYDWYGARISRCHATNAGDKGSCLARADADGVRVIEKITFVADEDIVITQAKTVTGSGAQCDVAAAAGQKEKRTTTDGRVVVAERDVIERTRTNGCVGAAGAIVKERTTTVGRVVVAGGVA